MAQPLAKVIHDAAFQRIATVIRCGLVPDFQSRHRAYAIATLSEQFLEASYHLEQDLASIEAYITALGRLLDAMQRSLPQLRILFDDVDWFRYRVYEHGFAVAIALVSATTLQPRFLTPGEICKAIESAGLTTDTSEEIWRKRAREGALPGALQKGGTWVVPADLIELLYGFPMSGATHATSDEGSS